MGDRLSDIERSLPDEIGLCPDPEHTEEFYMPHRGTCPWCANEMAVYVPEQQLRGAVEALRECARLSGADLSGGFPTWPDLPTFAVQCVRELREDYDAAGGQ